MTAQAALRSSPGHSLLAAGEGPSDPRTSRPRQRGAQPPSGSRLLSALAHGLCIFFSRLFPPAPPPNVRPSRCLCAPLPPPSALDALHVAAVAAGLERWPERRKRRKRGVRPGPCRSPRPGPATAPAPPPSQERTRPAWTGMGVRAAPSCAAAPAAAGAEPNRRPGLWPPSPPPPQLLLLLLLPSLGLLHAGRRGPGGERAARALFWVRNTTAPAGEQGAHRCGFTLLPSAPVTAGGRVPACGGRVRDRHPGALLLSAGVFTGARCGSGFRHPGRLRAETGSPVCAVPPLQLGVAARPGNRTRCKRFFFHPTLRGKFPRNLS